MRSAHASLPALPASARILLQIVPASSRLLKGLHGMGLLAVAVALLVTAHFFNLRWYKSAPWPGVACLLVAGLIFGLGRRHILHVAPPPYALAFVHGPGVWVLASADAQWAPFHPGAVWMGERLLAFSLVPTPQPQGSLDTVNKGSLVTTAKVVHWLSGVDAIGDENWRRLRSWVRWQERSRNGP